MTAPRFAPYRCAHPKSDHEALAPQCSAAGCSCLRYRPNLPATAPSTSPMQAHTPAPPARRPATDPRADHNRRPAPVVPIPAPDDTEPDPEPPTTPAPAAAAEPASELARYVNAGDPPDEQLTVDQLLERGRGSDLKPIVRLTERIDQLLEDLRERIAAETAAAGVKSMIAELEEKLAAAKNQLQTIAQGKRKQASSPDDHADAERHQCPDCPDTFGTAQGVTMHRTRKHGYRKAG